MSDIFDYFRRVADKPDDWSSEELSGADIKFILGEIERLRADNAAMLEVVKLILVFNKGNPHPEDEDSWCWFARGIVDKAEAIVARAEGRDD